MKVNKYCWIELDNGDCVPEDHKLFDAYLKAWVSNIKVSKNWLFVSSCFPVEHYPQKKIIAETDTNKLDIN